MLQNEFITTSSIQTKKLGTMLAQELRGGPASTRENDRSSASSQGVLSTTRDGSTRGGEIICLSGELGGGKTTFTQGLLKGLKVKGPYTSPTFNIIKHYRAAHNAKRGAKNSKTLRVPRSTFHDIYHIDAYRITAKDLLDLGWKDFAGKPDSIVIIEWAERVKKIIPRGALWISFKWLSEKERKITLSSKK